MTELPTPLREALERSGLVEAGARVTGEPLTGGVSSDIWLVETDGRQVCIKRALERLNVKKVWHAPTARHASEAAWFRESGTIAPGNVPKILAHDRPSGSLVMEYLPPEAYPVWKSQLRDGIVDKTTVEEIAGLLGRIHAATARRPHLAEDFDSDLFYHLRLEPYFAALAEPYPELASVLQDTIEQVRRNSRVMVHGDFSPKNILVGPDGPVVLDAECATWGDPAFDLAFCLNHLLLKSIWNRPAAARFEAGFDQFLTRYLKAVDWEKAADLKHRSARLLSFMMLARIDGKSPVEYINSEHEKVFVRTIALDLIRDPVGSPRDVADAWFAKHAQILDEKGPSDG
jgi:fructosamine-3-kinase